MKIAFTGDFSFTKYFKNAIQKYLLSTEGKEFTEEYWKDYLESNLKSRYTHAKIKDLLKGNALFLEKGTKTDRKEVYDYIINSSKQ